MKRKLLVFRYLRRENILLPRTFRKLDDVTANYVDHMFLDDEPIGYAGDLISGLSRFMPASRTRIPTTRLWFRNWKREVVSKRALPIPMKVMRGLAGLALALNRADLACLIPLGFLCFLRTGETTTSSPKT